MKKVMWRPRGDHMVIDTGHKTFDRQCESLGVGNTIGTCQFSWHIRPKNEIECNGYVFAIGSLRESDLKFFTRLPYHIKKDVESYTEHKGAYLSEIRHHVSGRKVIHGWILTRDSGEDYKFLKWWFANEGAKKAYSVMQTVREYISNP